MRPAEIARRLGVPASTVHGRLQAARRALRAQMGGDQPQPLAAGQPWRVAAALRAIRRRSFCGELEVGDRLVVFFTGVPAEVEVVPAADGLLRFQGTAWGIGQDTVDGLRLRQDGVPDAWRTGPHPGEVFLGTRGGGGPHPVAIRATTGQTWHRWTAAVEQEERQGDRVAARLRDLLGHPALRVSLVAPTAAAAWVGMPADKELDAAFVANNTSERGLHGTALRCALRLEVPARCALAVVALSPLAGPVTLAALAADVACVGGDAVSAERHAGLLLAWGAPLGRVADLRGDLLARHFTYGHGEWDDSAGRRPEPGRTEVQGVEGVLDVRVGRADLWLEGLRGEARVENRFGDTTLRSDGVDLRAELRSVAGAVTLEAAPGERPALVGTTAAGAVECEGDIDRDWNARCSNDPTLLGVYGREEARLRLHSEAGVVRLRRAR